MKKISKISAVFLCFGLLTGLCACATEKETRNAEDYTGNVRFYPDISIDDTPETEAIALEEVEEADCKYTYDFPTGGNWILANPEKYLSLAVGDEGDFELSLAPVGGLEVTGAFAPAENYSPYLLVKGDSLLHYKADQSGTFQINFEGLYDEETCNRLFKQRPNTCFPHYSQESSITVIIGDPVYRLYNPQSGQHFYTADTSEKDSLEQTGWNTEGEAWISAPQSTASYNEQAEENDPVYRLCNEKDGTRIYTLSSEEREDLISKGWKDEGIAWYSLKENEQGVVRPVVLRLYHPDDGSNTRFYTISLQEAASLMAQGWKFEGTLGTSLR